MGYDADVVIVGGGLVGTSLVCALADAPLRVLQIESQLPAMDAEPRWDERNFALARRSVRTLERYGVWTHAREQAHPIRHVRVSSRGDFGALRLHADDYGVPALGWTTPARVLGRALEVTAAKASRIERIAPATVTAIVVDADAVSVSIESKTGPRELRARLLVAADGTRSFVRDALGIACVHRNYGQTAIVATIEISGAHDDCAHERFTESGPLALLPLSGNRCGLIWTVPATQADITMAWSDSEFLAAAHARFGSRLGEFRRVGRRQTWPLALTRARGLTATRSVLIGNAAQTIHPIGAQGFNLGLRDVDDLQRMLIDAAAGGTDPGDAGVLAAYAQQREPDRERTIALTDTLIGAFARRDLVSRLGRGFALAALERMPGLKQDLAWAMMGHAAAESVPS